MRPLRDVAEVKADGVDVMPFPAPDDLVPKGMQNYYINFMSGGDDHRAPDNYGANCERLAAVKARYDPDNLLHINQNIVSANGS